jgi:hypothetical protein
MPAGSIAADHEAKRVVALVGLEPRLDAGLQARGVAVGAIEDAAIMEGDRLTLRVLLDVGDQGVRSGASQARPNRAKIVQLVHASSCVLLRLFPAGRGQSTTKHTYVVPSSLIAIDDNAPLAAAAKQLDNKLEALMTLAPG